MGMPRTQRENDRVFVVVDRFRKISLVLPWKLTNDASHIENLFFKEVIRIHGLPLNIVSDRDVKFVGHFWRNLWRKLGTNLSFSSAYHPQIDGQIEVINRTLGNLLRTLTRKHTAKWDVILTQDEFAFNDSINRSIGKSPFQVVYGIHPRRIFELRDMSSHQQVSAQGEEFATTIKEIHDEVEAQLQQTSDKYKKHTSLKW